MSLTVYNLPCCLSLIGLCFAPILVYLVHLMALRFGVSDDLIVAGYVIVVDLNSVPPDSSVVRAFGIYPEGPGFKSLSGHFYMFNILFLIHLSLPLMYMLSDHTSVWKVRYAHVIALFLGNMLFLLFIHL